MPWRNMLFVPGNKPDLAAKASKWSPDVVVLDLEDAVPIQDKVAAREMVRDAAAGLAGSATVCVRINPPGSEWFEGDVAALPDGIAAVVVPKFESPIDLGRPVVAGIETVRGVLTAADALAGSTAACYFGAEDYIADLGGIRTGSNEEVAHARAMVAMAARLAGIPALDMVTLDFHDADRFGREAREARALGYAGKLCIHPSQVALAADSFRPSVEELDWAHRLLEAFREAQGTTIAFEGQMVDEVVARRARAILAVSDDS
jgi:citrate lyase subunit beta/citryl-CoA lyase